VENIGNSLENGLQGSLLGSQSLGKSAAKVAAQGADGSADNIIQGFGDMLKDQMAQINTLQNNAEESKLTYATGGDIPLHNVLIAAEKANLSMELAMQVRNKVIAGYQEIMHMNI